MKVLTLATVFPNPDQPTLGLFVRERMRRVAERAAVRVVAPVPRSPLDGVVRAFRPGFRSARPRAWRTEGGLAVSHPPVFCLPGILKSLDGWFYYRSLLRFLRTFREAFPFLLLDAHFAFPDGVAAGLLARRLGVPFVVTLRGTAPKYGADPFRAAWMRRALRRAAAVVAVSASLARTARDLGCPEERIRVIPNGVDLDRFRPGDRRACRARLGLPEKAPVLLTVGSLVERKGIHRVIALLPELCARHPGLRYVAVGGPSPEGNYAERLRVQVRTLGLEEVVRLEGPRPPEALPEYYGAADLSVLATSNEGWCNALMESLACGTPVVTTDVGGNREIVDTDRVGCVVPPGDGTAFLEAVDGALRRPWDPGQVRARVEGCDWQAVGRRVAELFAEVLGVNGRKPPPGHPDGPCTPARARRGG